MAFQTEIERAWSLFRVGAFTEAERVLSHCPQSPESERLRLWMALRRGEPSTRATYGAWLAENATGDLAAVGRAHENAALVSMGESLKPWIEANTRWAQSEVAFAKARIAFNERRALDIRSELAQAAPYTAEQRVRYAQLRAWSKALNDDLESQATQLIHALMLALREGVDRDLIAANAEALAPLIREIDLDALNDHAESLLSRIEWPLENTVGRFYTQRALAWMRAARGEWIEALRRLDETLAVAPDDMRRGLVLADRARVHRAAREGAASASSCASALAFFERVDWSTAVREEAMGVFGAMDVLSEAPQAAKTLFECASRATVSRDIGGGHGQRLHAFRLFAESYILDGEEAFQSAQEAYRIFKSIKYAHRAAACALRAVELGGGARWRTRVERFAERFPRSLAAVEYSRMTSPLATLPVRMLQVAQLLASTGQSIQEIAATLGMAEGTVRVHVRRLNHRLNIRSRAELVRLFMEPGSAA